MIKIDKENWKVETDCRTVGEFMTEAASIFRHDLTIKVDGCRYDLFDNPKLRVSDSTPIDEVTYASTPGSMTFAIKTKPKPKTVTKSGWVNVYAKGDSRITGRTVFTSENAAKATSFSGGVARVATVRIEWEEVTE